MATVDSYKPAVAMVCLQFIYSGLALFTKAALVQGMSPRVFVVYRQGLATLIMTCLVCFTRWRNPSSKSSIGVRSFCLIFVTSLIGITGNQNAYFEGLNLSSSSIATAMTNLIPALTFVMAAIIGLEKVNGSSLSSIAKILGTFICVSGAITMALVKGQKLLNIQFLPSKFVFGIGGGENLQLGCFLLFACSCFWSFWLIMQVPVSASCPDHLISSTWMCFLSTIQSAIFTLFIDHDLEIWYLHSFVEIGSFIYGGIGAAVSFFLQSWCISQRGPLFSAMFSPLCTVITTITAALFLHEKLYIGSLAGAIAVVIGLYVVLWGKAKELEEVNQDMKAKLQFDDILQDECLENTSCKINLEEPLLAHKSV